MLFDCDGVLVDSETITNGVLRDMLAEQGWQLGLQECMEIFLGKAVLDERVRIEQATGKALSADWMAAFRQRRNQALQNGVQAIRHAHQAVHYLHLAMQQRIACASGADRHKVELVLAQVGLLDYFAGRIFSGHEMPRSKPHPDVYLAAAAALQVPASDCAVVEDTLTGLAAGLAAGATVFAYVPSGDGQAFLDAGAHCVFDDMAHLPDLLRH